MKQRTRPGKNRKESITHAEFWALKSTDERLGAVEILRRQWYKMNNERPKRLRRVFRVIKSGKS